MSKSLNSASGLDIFCFFSTKNLFTLLLLKEYTSWASWSSVLSLMFCRCCFERAAHGCVIPPWSTFTKLPPFMHSFLSLPNKARKISQTKIIYSNFLYLSLFIFSNIVSLLTEIKTLFFNCLITCVLSSSLTKYIY